MGMVLSFVAMAVGLIGLIVCAKKQQTNPALQPVAMACLLVVLVGLGYVVYDRVFKDKGAEAMENELEFRLARIAKVGEIIKRDFSGKKVVFIANSGYDKVERTKADVEAIVAELKKACGVDVKIIALPQPTGDEGAIDEVTVEGLDAITTPEGDNVVFVSDIMLPITNPHRCKMLTNKNNAVILLNGTPENRRAMLSFVKQGRLVCIDYKPLPKLKKGQKREPIIATGERAKDFDVRYVIVDKSNVKDAEWK